jgi:periplasmic protein CpxP/Spy
MRAASVPAFGCAVGVAALIFALAANGEAPSSDAPSPAPPASPGLSAGARAAVDERIAQLQSQLGITPSQLPLWSAFAAAMRDNAAATDALFARRAGAVATMNAEENMRSYAEIARAYADNTEHLATAFDRLYASLSDTQKQAADTLFREQAAAAARPRSGRR